MADSWEDLDQQPHAQASAQRKAPANTGLNPNASSFSFNPSASSFTPPTFAPKAQTASPEARSAQDSAEPANSQAQATDQVSHSATNGVSDHKHSAQPMQVDPPSEREVPVASASTAAEDVDQPMQEADGPMSAGIVRTRE